jgi:2-keto-3-deoxy-6-phosphogluconate aldolase
VTEQNAADFLRAGAFGVGFVGTLFVPDDVKHGRWEAIRARAAAMVQAVRI